MSEFSLIDKYFNNRGYQRSDVQLGIGDDCAVLKVPEQKSIIVSTDTLVAGHHFHQDMPAHAIGHKCLAVNLSDIAAMGGEAAWVSLALTIPEENESWLSEFSRGFVDLAEYFQVHLVGGDTTQGPLSVTVTIQGFVPNNSWLSRSGARVGDWIYVTGNLGDAGLALDALQNKVAITADNFAKVKERLEYPTARLLAGQALRGRANSALDLSDGLVGDLQHILNASMVGAKINVEDIPLSEPMLQSVEFDEAIKYALSAGDDYELCFTVSEEHKGSLITSLAHTGVKLTCIGQITPHPGKIQLTLDGVNYPFNYDAFEHFKS